jgi:hypothetical protein
MRDERLIAKDVEGSGRDTVLMHYTGICVEGLRKTMKTSGEPVSGYRFGPRTSLIRNWSVNHSTEML